MWNAHFHWHSRQGENRIRHLISPLLHQAPLHCVPCFGSNTIIIYHVCHCPSKTCYYVFRFGVAWLLIIIAGMSVGIYRRWRIRKMQINTNNGVPVGGRVNQLPPQRNTYGAYTNIIICDHGWIPLIHDGLNQYNLFNGRFLDLGYDNTISQYYYYTVKRYGSLNKQANYSLPI